MTDYQPTLSPIISPNLPNNDSFIDITSPKSEIEPPTQRKVGKTVQFNEQGPEMRSPSSQQMTPSSSSNITTLAHTSPLSKSNRDNNTNTNNNNDNNTASQPSSYIPIVCNTSQPIKTMTPVQYLLLTMAKIYQPLFLIAHLIFHIFIFALLIYTVSRIPGSEITTAVDGFTVFLFAQTIMQIITVIVGIISFQGSELALQIYVAITGLALIIHTISMFFWLLLFRPLIKHLKETYNGIESIDTIQSTTTLITLFDILIDFYTILAICHVLDCVGLIGSIITIQYKIRRLYDYPPNETFKFSSLFQFTSTNNNSTNMNNDIIDVPQPEQSITRGHNALGAVEEATIH